MNIQNGVKTPYNIRVTQTVLYMQATPFQWIGAVITVDCTITRIDVPNAPTETSYLIGSGDLSITLAPAFTQYPPCEYTLTEYMLWTFNPTPSPVTPNAANKYNFVINSNTLTDARTQTLTLSNSITYSSQTFSPSLSFNIELLHPCRRTTFNDATMT